MHRARTGKGPTRIGREGEEGGGERRARDMGSAVALKARPLNRGRVEPEVGGSLWRGRDVMRCVARARGRSAGTTRSAGTRWIHSNALNDLIGQSIVAR